MSIPKAVWPPALLFFTAGVLHFVMPAFFDRIVPEWVPNARLATYVSGACEMLGAIGLIIPATRAAAGWGLIALLLAVFPANVHMLMQARDAGASAVYVAGLWARLPVQGLLIWWVYSTSRLR